MEVEDVVLVRAEVVVEEMYLVRNGAGNNESCSMEEGQIYDFDERNLSDQNVSSDIKASCDSIVEEYGNFRVNCGSKQAIWGSSCKLSEDENHGCGSDSSEWCWGFFGEGMRSSRTKEGGG